MSREVQDHAETDAWVAEFLFLMRTGRGHEAAMKVAAHIEECDVCFERLCREADVKREGETWEVTLSDTQWIEFMGGRSIKAVLKEKVTPFQKWPRLGPPRKSTKRLP